MNQIPHGPVTSRFPALPFSDLAWERFEQFAHDLLLALPRMRPETAHRYGTQGQAQRGIDLTVQRDTGDRWAFSNKRYAKTTYQPSHVRRHIAETTYSADRYVILISGVASADVRDEIRNHPNWELWDAEDLSQRVRLELQPEIARRLVDHHFGPIWRRDFLGLPAVGAFVPASDCFRPFLDTGRLFHHAIPLVGRGQLLREIGEFAANGPERVLVFPGRGGIGKSRLLREVAESLDIDQPNQAVRFLSDGVPVTLEALNELPAVPTTVIVDDAHRRNDLGPLHAWLRQRSDCRLLLATRPQGTDYLLSELTRAGVDATQIRRLSPIERLSKEEVLELAQHALGADNEELADRLARITKDCPLVTVVGGRLLADRAVRPELLERDEDFRQEVLNRFREEMLGKVSETISPDLCRRILEVVAALNPVPPDAGPTHDQTASFLNVSPPDVTKAIGELERIGLLVRRGRLVRLTPDVLADHILNSACLTPQGNSTGFADRLFEAFGGSHFSQLFRNLAELDWRMRAGGEADPDLLERVWSKLQQAFRRGGHRERAELLDMLKDSAYFLPNRVFELVLFAVRNPASSDEEEVIPGWFSYSHENVRRVVPELLRRCSVSATCLPMCLDLLWELDRSEERATNSNTEHPFRIITQLSEYGLEKPLWVNAGVLTAARRWLNHPDAFDRRHTPLDALDPLLAKSGIEHDSDGRTISMRPFLLNYESVRELRCEVLACIATCLMSGNTRAALRATRSLGTALNGPAPYMALQITAEVLAQWQDEQLQILGLFRQLVVTNPPAVIFLAIIREVRFQARDVSLTAVREQANALVRSIDRTFDFRLTRMLLPDMSRWDFFEDEGDDANDPVTWREARHRELARSVVTDFWERFPEALAAFTELDHRLRELRSVEPKSETGNLLWWLLDNRPEVAITVARRMVLHPQSPVSESLSVVLSRISSASSTDAIAICIEALNSRAIELRRGVAHFCEWGMRDQNELNEHEITLYDRLIADDDSFVRRAGIATLRRIARFRPRDAITRMLAINPGTDEGVATELCRLVDANWEGVPQQFTPDEIVKLLEKLDHVGGIDSNFSEFLRHAWEAVPHAVLDLFFRRIEIDQNHDYRSKYQSIPSEYDVHTFQYLKYLPQHKELLHRIRDRALSADASDRWTLSRLYQHVSLGYGAVGTEVLDEWFLSGDEREIRTAGDLLQHAGRNFVLDRPDVVRQILDRALTFGEQCLMDVSFDLSRIVIYGSRFGTPGQPFPEDINIRDKCQKILKQFPFGSAAHRFFTDLHKASERNIQRTIREDDDD